MKHDPYELYHLIFDLTNHFSGFRVVDTCGNSSLDLPIREFIRFIIFFCLQVYPDENHNLEGVISHVHQSMEAFLDDCFWEFPTGSVTSHQNESPLHLEEKRWDNGASQLNTHSIPVDQIDIPRTLIGHIVLEWASPIPLRQYHSLLVDTSCLFEVIYILPLFPMQFLQLLKVPHYDTVHFFEHSNLGKEIHFSCCFLEFPSFIQISSDEVKKY